MKTLIHVSCMLSTPLSHPLTSFLTRYGPGLVGGGLGWEAEAGALCSHLDFCHQLARQPWTSHLASLVHGKYHFLPSCSPPAPSPLTFPRSEVETRENTVPAPLSCIVNDYAYTVRPVLTRKLSEWGILVN